MIEFLRWLMFLPPSAISASSKQSFDLIVIAEERNEQIRWAVLKNEAQRASAATLEYFVA